MLMLMNPGWLLSKTWAWIARLPFSLYQKTGAAVQEEWKNILPIHSVSLRLYYFSFSLLSTRQHVYCQLVN